MSVDFTRVGQGQAAVAVDQGLRAYMLNVYNYMASGIFLTAIVAMLTVKVPALLAMMYQVTPEGQIAGMTPFGWIVAFAPIGLVLLLGFGQHKLSVGASKAIFWGYATLMGLSLSSIFLAYTGASITRVLFITGGVFGAMSIYGYTTKRDLTGLGSFLFMGVIGVLIAGVVNIFLQSSMLYFLTSLIGVGLAVGLTAYDTQKVKEVYFYAGGGEAGKKAAVMGALTLYIDFIYLFINLMRLMGERR